MTTTETPTLTGEKAELLGALAKHRFLFRHTVRGLTDEQAAATPTASELCLGGLIKHVAHGERGWLRFVVEGTAAMAMHENSYAEHAASFRMLAGRIVAELPSLDVAHPLPEAPWFEPGEGWSARRVLVHVIAETAQHAGHADILRETIDGQKSMG
jgi:uncharacterized damage-inducible protein DinB